MVGLEIPEYLPSEDVDLKMCSLGGCSCGVVRDPWRLLLCMYVTVQVANGEQGIMNYEY